MKEPIGKLKARCALGARDVTNAAVGAARTALFLRRTPPSSPKRIVVHHVGNIGDVVTAIPAFVALRDHFPHATITLVTSPGPRGRPGAKDLLEGARYFDKVVEYSLEDIRAPNGPSNLLRSVRRLRPEVLIMLPPSMMSARALFRNLAFARLTGADFVIGLETPTLSFFLLDQAYQVGQCQNEVERNLDLLRPLGVTKAPVRFELAPIPDQERRRVDGLAGRIGPFVAVCPGGKQFTHLWPPERFAAVCRRIRTDTKQRVVAIGSKAEWETCQRVLDEVGGGTNTSGSLSVRGTTELLRRATMLLTNDTGPMHLAVAVGTPVVAIFSSRDFAGRWYPWGNGHEVLRAREVCDTCLFAPSPTDHCVREIGVDEVVAACLRVVSRRTNASVVES